MESDGATLKQVEAQLAKMTKVFVDGADPILIFDLDRSVLDMNFETERVFGWSRAELVGGPTRHLLPPELHPLADSVWERPRKHFKPMSRSSGNAAHSNIGQFRPGY